MAMQTQASVAPVTRIARMKMQMALSRRTIRRRLIGALLFGVGIFVIPIVAAAAPVEHKTFSVPKLDRRAIENLQRWVNDGHDTWCKDPQLVASMEMRRIAPDFAGYQFDLASLPLEKELSGADRVVFKYTSVDGRTMYRITLRRYAWLLPIAGEQKSIVWVPARTETVSNR
jgi:hypothetical protein